MFSQFRNVLESIQDAVSPELPNVDPTRRQSLDTKTNSPHPSNPVADSAASSLKKTFAAQRSNGTGSSRQPTSQSDSPRPHKSNLEERLRRATFAIGEPSPSTTPNKSNRASPSPMSRNTVKQHPLSPSSTPLPASPISQPLKEGAAQLPIPSELPLHPESKRQEASLIMQPIPVKPAPIRLDSIERDSKISKSETPIEVEHPLTESQSTEEPEDFTRETRQPLPEESTPTTPESSIPEAPLTERRGESPKEENKTTSSESSSVGQGAFMQDSSSISMALDTSGPVVIQPDSIVSNEPPLNTDAKPMEYKQTTEIQDPATESNTPNDAQPSSTNSLSDSNSNDSEKDKKLDGLQERLKQVEQRFADVSISFKRLQAEKLAADSVLRENTLLDGIGDTNALREFLTSSKNKEEVFQDEIKRLNQKLEAQEDTLEELRETHQKAARSRSEELNKVRTQLDETEALFQAAQRATTEVEDASTAYQAEITRLSKEIESVKGNAKEEEEKRVKAISLLKTVRQKLVKAEKDREDVLKEMAALKDRERGDKDKEEVDRLNFQHEVESLKSNHAAAVASLKAQFDKDTSALRERQEQEILLLKNQFNSESMSTKEAYSKELAFKSTQITNLQTSLNVVTQDKNAFFDQLQLRRAELESAQEHLTSLQHQNNELQFQERETNDRLLLLREECAELAREQETRARDPAASADEIARAVSAVEMKYESRLTEMKRNLNIMEKERYESEADWSRKLKEKVKQLEDLKKILGSAAKSKEDEEVVLETLKSDLARSQALVGNLQKQVAELPQLRHRINELENLAREQDDEARLRGNVFEKQLEEAKAREAQLKASIKTLREELRKVQSSAALLERQRNPGVGYWTARTTDSNGDAVSPSTTQQSPSRTASPAPNTTKEEEEVNLEYLRNVILQFLEHKEMRPNLVKVLSIILHFTPQETRRLIAKV